MPLSSVPDDSSENNPSPWEDPSSFHTKGREETAVPISVRVPNATARAIAKIVQSGRFPGLETNSDALRDATWRWVRWMADVMADEEMAHQLDMQRSHWKMEAALRQREQLTSILDAAEKLLTDEGSGEQTKRKVLTELSALILKIEDSGLRRRMVELVAKHR